MSASSTPSIPSGKSLARRWGSISLRAKLRGMAVLSIGPWWVGSAWMIGAPGAAAMGAWPWVAAMAAAAVTVTWLLVSRDVLHALSALGQAAGAGARGDLRALTAIAGNDELAQISRDLERMNDGVSGAVSQVRSQAILLSMAGETLAENSSELSQRAEAQAQSVQKSAASIQELSSSFAQNAHAATSIDDMTRSVLAEAESGLQAMQLAEQSMQSINAQSRRMDEIIGVIDGIAFQTNILALNAAVEAARAGDHGRGFSVVAAEVRTLAQRCGASAKEIRGLIQQTSEGISEGGVRIAAVGERLGAMAKGLRDVAEGISGMARANGEQKASVQDIAQAIRVIDDIAQRNVAMVEKTLTDARSVRERASGLTSALTGVRLRRGSADEAYAMVKKAQTYLQQHGLEAAKREFQQPEGRTAFRDRDLYIFVFDRQGRYHIFGSSPERVGCRIHDIPGIDGDQLLHDAFAVAAQGGGWVNYQVTNPLNNEIEPKTSYVEPVSGDLVIGCGVYKPKLVFSA